MNRREFVRLAGAGMSAAALAEAVVSAQQAQAPAQSGIVAPTTSPKVKMKVGTQHGHSDADPPRVRRLRRQQHLQRPAVREDGRGVVGRFAVEAPRARRVARHLARHGAAADELIGDLAGGDARHLSWARARIAIATSTTSAR